MHRPVYLGSGNQTHYLTPVKTDKAEGFVKIQSTGNAGSSPHCLNASAFAPQQTSNILSIFPDVL